MARLATLAVLLLSLLAVASCRVLDVEAISDDQGAGAANPVLLTQDDQADAAAASEVTPTVAGGEGVLRLPSHRRPCHLHRHLWWARHHGLSHHRAAFSGPGVVPTVEEQEPIEAELVAVAEPDPDSRPDTDGEQKPFHGEEEGEAATAWKVEMLRRFRHGIRFHHRHHHEQDGEEQVVKDEGDNMKLFGRFHHRHHLRHHHEHEEEDDDHEHEDKDEVTNMKLLGRFHRHQHHAHDSDGEVDEVEELARRLSQAIIRRSVSHGGHHHHHHHHGAAAAEGRVKKWFKGLMNRF